MAVLSLVAAGRPQVLPPLDAAEEAAVVEAFSAVVTRLSCLNPEPGVWWYGWLSCRDQHNAPLLELMRRLARASKALAAAPGDLTLTIAEPWLADAVAETAQAMGRTVRRAPRDRLRWAASRGWRRAAPAVDGAKVLRHGLLAWRDARRFPRPAADLGGHDVVMVTILHPRPDLRAPWRDTYFGQLWEHLRAAGERVLVVGQILGDSRAVTAQAAAVSAPTVATLGHALTLPDVVRAALYALGARPRLAGAETGPVRHLLAAGQGRAVIYAGLAKLLEHAVARLLAANPAARVLHLYENNPWERAVDVAARRAGRPTTGYLHCAVLPSHLKNRVDPAEQPLRPAPDRIVCTGPAARAVFLSLGPHDPAAVAAGCDLRGPPLDGLPRRAGPPRAVRRILVVLEGIEKMVGLLRLCDAVAAQNPHLTMLLRPHPAMGLDILAPLAGISVGPDARLRRSTPPALADSVAEADVVLYQGTTAALTLGYTGVPLLRYDGGMVPTDDPLFMVSALKREVRTTEDFAAALAHFETMSVAAYHAEAAALRDYVADYLAPPSSAAMAVFGRGARRANAAND